MAAKRKASVAPTYVDFVVRFSKPGTYMRSQVLRALDEAGAMQAAMSAVESGHWVGWAIVDVVTVEEAKARTGVTNG